MSLHVSESAVILSSCNLHVSESAVILSPCSEVLFGLEAPRLHCHRRYLQHLPSCSGDAATLG